MHGDHQGCKPFRRTAPTSQISSALAAPSTIHYHPKFIPSSTKEYRDQTGLFRASPGHPEDPCIGKPDSQAVYRPHVRKTVRSAANHYPAQHPQTPSQSPHRGMGVSTEKRASAGKAIHFGCRPHQRVQPALPTLSHRPASARQKGPTNAVGGFHRSHRSNGPVGL